LRVSPFLQRVAAALIVVLLPLVMLWEGASAQDSVGGVTRTITNIAEASWQTNGRPARVASNEVRFDVNLPPARIRVFQATDNGGTAWDFRTPKCSASSGSGATGASASGDPTSGGSEPFMITSTVTPTTHLRAGRMLYFEVTASAANRDPATIDQLEVVITTSTGDREQLTIFETAVNSGVFAGRIETSRMPPLPVIEDCRLSLINGASIDIAAMVPGTGTVMVRTEVEALADPFGIVFDSETGEPVNDARVTLIDDATGAPAMVFADDGVTPWPSTVFSGQAIVDGAGRSTPMQPGEYLFPLTALGRYRLAIEPPAPYSAPSRANPADLARLTRPDGGSYTIVDASFGGTLMLVDTTPVEVDIPLDRPSLDLALTKTASRPSAAPGDVVFYVLQARNLDEGRPKRNVTITDIPSRWLRLRRDSVRINGSAQPDAVTIAPDGRSLTIALGDLAGGESARVTYAMSVRPDAPPGRALNDASISDSLGRIARASAVLDVERESIADRMTILGRITAGGCNVDEKSRKGIPGVRVVMEDGSFAITDGDGRYHFEGVVPGTHVVQVAQMTLPQGAQLVDCHRSTRNAGSASSRFAIGQGGSLVVADFHAILPAGVTLDSITPAPAAPAAAEERGISARQSDADAADETATKPTESGADSDWLAMGDGPDGFLSPSEDANPRSPAIRIAIRHRRGQTVALFADGKPVDPLTFEGTRNPESGKYAVSQWRGVPLINERTFLEARVTNSFGEVSQTFNREVFFTRTPAKIQLVPEQSSLVADGRTRPVVAIRVLDRNNRPLREGMSGSFTLNAPFESAEQLDRQQLNQLTGMAPSGARWVVEGNEGIARIELAPTMVSGSLRLEFLLGDGQVTRRQEVEAWVEPGDVEWTIVGLIEGSVGARSVADNMERAGRFDSDLGENARVALYAKGRVLGKYLLTLAYDSAKQREDQRVLGALDPQAYYTVFGDASARRFDAASRENLYVRIETSTFYALYGDFQTALNQTSLANYNRTATGVKGEARFGALRAQGFAAEISSRFQRQETQGQGISGPYQLTNRRILPNSERVTIEVRDRFRSELVLSTREMARFIDYDLDLLAGTITFKQPVLSRDENLNPQFIVIEYETDGAGEARVNAGMRADWTSQDGRLRIGASAISDAGSADGDESRTNIGAIDVLAQLGTSTELRAEFGMSHRNGDTANGWLFEAQHQTAKVDVLAYARQVDTEYGIGQQNGAELGRRKFGADGRVLLSQHLSLLGSVWQDDSLNDLARRRAAQTQLMLNRQSTDLRIGLAHFTDRLIDGSTASSTVLEAGVTQRLFNNRLEFSGSTAIALGKAESLDLPARHRIGARYSITRDVRLVGTYEIADGKNIDARQGRVGLEVAPWRGGRVVTSVGQDTINEFGNRTFAAFGLSQTLQLTKTLTIDGTVDSNRTLGNAPDRSLVVNPQQPVASGGQLTGVELFEDFNAFTFGAAWRKDRWNMTARGEYRDGESAERKGVTFGAIRQLGEGSMVGSGGTWTRASTRGGASTEIMDASIAFAHRPDASPIAMLGKLEFRSDKVANAVAGEAGGAGRTALIVDGDATSRRLIASLSTNWSPRGSVTNASDAMQQVRRDEYSLFLGARHNFDQFEGTEFSGTTVLAGVDARHGIGDRFEIGASATVRSNVTDKVTSFAYGPAIGFVPAEGMLLTVGYNIAGFRDADFAAARDTNKGVFAAVRMKFDTSTFGFLDLER